MLSYFISLMGGGAVQSTTQASSSSGSSLGNVLPMILVFAALILLMIIPQRKKDKQKKNMLSSIKKGDKVETIGGIRGTVVAVKETSVIIKVDSDARIEFAKGAIAEVLIAKPSAQSSKNAKSVNKDDVNISVKPHRKGEEMHDEKHEEKEEVNTESATEVKPEENEKKGNE